MSVLKSGSSRPCVLLCWQVSRKRAGVNPGDGPSEKRSASTAQLTCETCHTTFKSAQALREHSKFAHLEVSCPICGKKFTSNSKSATRRLTLHLPVCQLSNVRHKCLFLGCDQRFRTKVELHHHEKECDKPKVFKCPFCDFIHRDKSALGRHKNQNCAHNPKIIQQPSS